MVEDPIRILLAPLDPDARSEPLRLPRHVQAETALGTELRNGAVVERLRAMAAVVLDARAPGEDGEGHVQDLLRRLRSEDADCPVLVVVAGEPASPLAVAAATAGAWEVLTQEEVAGDGLGERLRAAARLRALRRSGALAASKPVTAPAAEPSEDEPLQMVGTSEAIQQVFRLIRRVAASDVPVLLTGESGTGKELAALAIHDHSPRAEHPFVPINCGAIPEALLESELFGYEKGAFTGASQSRKGRFELADGGTLFLDEVGELAPSLQVKLLRFLQDHVVERVGGRGGLALDVRVLAASNRDLPEMVKRGEFREDLYFRLAVLTVELPPLRERGEDILLLARFFLERYAREAGKTLRGFTREAVAALLEQRWPGNVRELINRVRRAVVICEGSLVGPTDLGLEPCTQPRTVVTLREARRQAERECLRSALQRAQGSKIEAARLLGISRTQLYELLARHRVPDTEHAAP